MTDAFDAKFCRTCVERLVPTSKGHFHSGEGILGDRDHMVDLGVDGGQFSNYLQENWCKDIQWIHFSQERGEGTG